MHSAGEPAVPCADNGRVVMIDPGERERVAQSLALTDGHGDVDRAVRDESGRVFRVHIRNGIGERRERDERGVGSVRVARVGADVADALTGVVPSEQARLGRGRPVVARAAGRRGDVGRHIEEVGGTEVVDAGLHRARMSKVAADVTLRAGDARAGREERGEVSARRGAPNAEAGGVEVVSFRVRAEPAHGALHVVNLRRKDNGQRVIKVGLTCQPIRDTRDGHAAPEQRDDERRDRKPSAALPPAAVYPDNDWKRTGSGRGKV